MTTVGVDIGGSSVKFATVLDGRVQRRGTWPIDPADGPAATYLRLRTKIGALAVDARVGVAIAGLVEDGWLVSAVNLPTWVGACIRTELSDRLERDVVVVCDALAAAVAERDAGGHPAGADLAVFTLGTGVGTATVLDGVPRHGGGGQLRGPAARCTGRTFEDLLGSAALVRRYAGPGGLRQGCTVADIGRAARSGDARARSVLERAGEVVGAAAADVAQLLIVDRVVVGGGVSRSPAPFWPGVTRAFADRLDPDLRGRCVVRRSQLGRCAGAIGAAFAAAPART